MNFLFKCFIAIPSPLYSHRGVDKSIFQASVMLHKRAQAYNSVSSYSFTSSLVM